MGKRDSQPAPAAPKTGVGGLGAALMARGLAPTQRAEPVPDAPPTPPPAPRGPALGRRAVLAIEKKGRGGKTVTTIADLVSTPNDLEAMAQQIRRAMGCGAVIEEAKIVVQGDQRDRLRAFIQGLGVTDIRG
jgi:translation initiation factor 1